MRKRNALNFALALTLVGLGSGCNSKSSVGEIPEVTDENCRPEIIQQIEDKAAQQDFAGKCSRRGSFKPSDPKNW